jgi:hypothetical protein
MQHLVLRPLARTRAWGRSRQRQIRQFAWLVQGCVSIAIWLWALLTQNLTVMAIAALVVLWDSMNRLRAWLAEQLSRRRRP